MKEINPINEVVVQVLHKLVCHESPTKEETDILDTWVAQSSFNKDVLHELTDDEQLKQSLKDLYSVDKEMLWKK